MKSGFPGLNLSVEAGSQLTVSCKSPSSDWLTRMRSAKHQHDYHGVEIYSHFGRVVVTFWSKMFTGITYGDTTQLIVNPQLQAVSNYIVETTVTMIY